MKNQIYNAFVEAGFKREADRLSNTVDGKVQPALGHYIDILDTLNAPSLNGKFCGFMNEACDDARMNLNNFIIKNNNKLGFKIPEIGHRVEILDKFFNKYIQI